MATVNFTGLPATVAITNNAVPVEAFDAGTRPVTYDSAIARTADLALYAQVTTKGNIKTTTVVEPLFDLETNTMGTASVVKVKYKTGTRTFQMWKTNKVISIPSGDTVDVEATTAEQLAYYMALSADPDFTIVVTPTTASPVKVTSISIAPASAHIQVGATPKLTLTAICLPLDATVKTVTWVSGTPGKAAVNATTGELTAVAAGTTVITATAADGSGETATCTITVTAAAAG